MVEEDDIVVQVTITNHGDTPYRLLEWNLPEDGTMTKPLFRVYRGNSEIPFRPQVVVDQEIDDGDYETIQAGGTSSATIRLARAYDVRPEGRYRVQYEALNQLRAEKPAGQSTEWLRSKAVVVQRR